VTLSVPIELPGRSVAPFDTNPPMLPVPPIDARLSAVTVPPRLPFTTSFVPNTEVAPVKPLLFPVSVSERPPRTCKAPCPDMLPA
jgi:hypothetical protein